MSAERVALLSLLAMSAGCGSLVGGDYRGEKLFEIKGQVYTDGLDIDGDVGVALVWSNGYNEALGSQSVVVKTEFPARYTIELYEPPDATAFMPFLGDENVRAAVGDIVIYADENEDGRWNREDEEILGGAFEAAVIWVEEIGEDWQPDPAQPLPVDDPNPANDPDFENLFDSWVPEKGFNLVSRQAPFSCVEPWAQWLGALPDDRADLQVSYYFPAGYDWDCDGQWGMYGPEPPPDIFEECDPVVWAGECESFLDFLASSGNDPQIIQEQQIWLDQDPYMLACIEQECPEVLDILFPQ